MQNHSVVGGDRVVRCKYKSLIPDVDIYSFLESKLHSYGSRVAVVNTDTKNSLTYSQLIGQVDNVAVNLHRRGFELGQTMGVCCHNCFEFIVVTLAVFKLGGRVAPINKLLTRDEIQHALRLIQPQFICANKTVTPIFQDLRTVTDIKELITLGNLKGCISWSDLIQTPVSKEVLFSQRQAIHPSTGTAFILSSSGTTGLPKAVELTHRNIVAQVVHRGHPLMGYRGRRRLLYQPLSHIYGLTESVVSVAHGATVHFMPQFSLEGFLREVSDEKINVLLLVPPVIVQLAKSPLTSKHDLSHVTDCLCAAAPLSPKIEAEFKKYLPSDVIMRQGYGLTETTAGATNTLINDRGPEASIGIPLVNTEFKVIDVDTGEALAAGQIGELCMKGPQRMKGYLNNPRATEQTIDQEGWLHTGDVGFYDEDGYIFLVDRLKELIKYQAYQVAPAELEDLLLHHPAVVDAGVIGIPDEEKGELPMAWVVKKPGFEKITEREIMDFVAGRVAPFKRLRGGVKFVSTIPKSTSGKILRRQIRERTLARTASKL